MVNELIIINELNIYKWIIIDGSIDSIDSRKYNRDFNTSTTD